MFRAMKFHRQEASCRLQAFWYVIHKVCILQLTSWRWNFIARNMLQEFYEIKILIWVYIIGFNSNSCITMESLNNEICDVILAIAVIKRI
jgi:hypothetical protein